MKIAKSKLQKMIVEAVDELDRNELEHAIHDLKSDLRWIRSKIESTWPEGDLKELQTIAMIKMHIEKLNKMLEKRFENLFEAK